MLTYQDLPECEDCHGNYWQSVRRDDYNGPAKFVRCGLCDRLWRIECLQARPLGTLDFSVTTDLLAGRNPWAPESDRPCLVGSDEYKRRYGH